MEKARFEPVTDTLKRLGRDILTIMVCPPNNSYAPNGFGSAENHEQLKFSYDSEGNYHDEALRTERR